MAFFLNSSIPYRNEHGEQGIKITEVKHLHAYTYINMHTFFCISERKKKRKNEKKKKKNLLTYISHYNQLGKKVLKVIRST